MRYSPTKYDQGSFVAKDVVFGVTHIDSPVSFTLVTNIAPEVSESIGTPPVVQNVLFDSPLIQMVFEINNEQAWLYREMQKTVLALHGLVPIRCFELNQFLFPIDENYNIYSGVSSVLVDYIKDAKDENGIYDIQKTRSRINLDKFQQKAKTDSNTNMQEFADSFFDAYTPFFNVVNKETVQQSDGKITCVIFIQPVDMFSYFKDGIAYFIKDDAGIIKQEVINRYVNVHGFEQLESNARDMLRSLDKVFNGETTEAIKKITNASIATNYSFSLIDTLDINEEDIDGSLTEKSNTGVKEYNFFITDGLVNIVDRFSKENIYDLEKITSTERNKKIKNYTDLENITTVDGNKVFNRKVSVDKNIEILYEANTKEYQNSTKYPRIVIDDGDTFSYLEEKNAPRIDFRVQSLDTLETPKFKEKATLFGFAALSDSSRVSKHLYQLSLLDKQTNVTDDILLGTYFIFAICQGYLLEMDMKKAKQELEDKETLDFHYNLATKSYNRYVAVCPASTLKVTHRHSITTTMRPLTSDITDTFEITKDMITNAVKYFVELLEKKKNINLPQNLKEFFTIESDGSLKNYNEIRNKLVNIHSAIVKVNKQLTINAIDDYDVTNSKVYISDNKGIFSIYTDGSGKIKLHKKSPLVIPYRYSFDGDTSKYGVNFAFVNDVNQTVNLKNTVGEYSRELKIKIAEDEYVTINGLAMPTILLAKANRDIMANNKAYLPERFISTDIIVKDSVEFNVQEIQDMIKDIYLNHVTIYPELSKPYRKFLNALDEQYIKDNLKYRYTDVNTSSTYPLLYTSNMTLSPIKTVPSSDISLSYVSKNIANVKFIDVVKNGLYDILFSGSSGIKGVLDEYEPVTRTNIGITANPNNYFLNREIDVGEYIDTVGSIFTDIIMLSNDSTLIPGMRSIRMLSSMSDAINMLMTTVSEQYSSEYNTIIGDIYKKSKTKFNNVLGYRENGSVTILGDVSEDAKHLSYKDVSNRLIKFLKVLINDIALEFVKSVRDKRAAGLTSEEYFMFAENVKTFFDKLDDYYAKLSVSNASDIILKFEEAKNCSTSTICESIINSSMFSDFTKLIAFIKENIAELLTVTPINFIKKRIVISDNVKTSITAISHSFSSMNTPVINSDTNIGTYFQCIQQPDETVSIMVTTSDYNLMRQLLLINYSQNISGEQIVKTERLRTAGSTIQENSKVSILMNKIEKLFDDIVSQDPYNLDGLDLSMNLENDFLNSYGVKYIYINSIDINNVDNRAGVYTIQLNATRTIPKRIINNYLKTTEKSPLISSTMSSMTATYLSQTQSLKNVDSSLLPNVKTEDERNEYIEDHIRIVGQSSVLALIPVGSLAYLLYEIFTRSSYADSRKIDKIFKNFTSVNIDKTKKSIIDFSFIEMTYAFLDTMCSASMNECLTYIYDIKEIIEDYDVDYSGLSSTEISDLKASATIFDTVYDHLKSTIYGSILTEGKNNTVSSVVSSRTDFKNMILTAIEDLMDMASMNDFNFIRTMRTTCQMLIFGYRNLSFKYKFDDSMTVSALKNTIAEVDDTLQFARYLMKLNGKIENDLLINYDAKISEARSAASSMMTINNVKDEASGKTIETATINQGFQVKGSLLVDLELKDGYIYLKTLMTPQMIRAVSTVYDLLNKYGFLTFDYVEDFFIENDLTDNPLTKIFIEYFQVINAKDYITPFLNTPDSIKFDRMLSEGAKKLMFKRSYQIPGSKEYKIKTTMPEGRSYQRLITKLSPYAKRTEYDGIIKKDKTNSASYDVYSYMNRSDELKLFERNIFENSFASSFIYYCTELENLVCKYSSDGYDSYDRNTTDSSNFSSRRNQLIQTHNSTFIDICTNKINSKFIENINTSDEISNEIDHDRIRPIDHYLKSSLLGSCYYISINIASEFFKNNSASFVLGNRINSSFITEKPADLKKISYMSYNQYDIIILISSMMHFGTLGINNPYASAYFESSHSLSMPIVYAYDKSEIVKLLNSDEYTDMGIQSILTTMLIGSKVNQSPSFFITEDFQNSWATAYLTDLLTEISVSNTADSQVVKSSEIVFQTWMDKHKEIVNEAIKTSKKIKTQIKTINRRAETDGKSAVDGLIDDLINVLFSVDPFIASNPSIGSTDKNVNNQKLFERAQKLTDRIQKSIIESYSQATTTFEFSEVEMLVRTLLDSVERAAKSSKILELVETIGLDNFKSMAGMNLKNVANNIKGKDKHSELLRETAKTLHKMVTDVLFNNSEINALTVNNTSKLMSELKASTKENNNIISLRSAFPIVKILISKKGIPGLLVFDDYFTFSSINSVNIFSSVNSPSRIAEIYFSDPFNDIAQSLDTPVFGSKIKETMTDLAVSSADSFSQQTLSIGTGIQIRMGYSKNLDESNIVFNGQIEHLSIVDGKMVCGSSASTLLRPLYPNDMNIVIDKTDSTYDSDPTDATIAYEMTSKLMEMNPSAFEGIYGGLTTDYDQTYGYFSKTLRDIKKQYEVGARSSLTKLLTWVNTLGYINNNMKSSDIKKLLYMSNTINSKNEIFENFRPIRITTDVTKSMPNFVYIANTPVWHCLQEIQNHYQNHVLLTRPFDNRETLIFKHGSGLYKTTNAYSNELVNLEKIAHNFKTFNETNKTVYLNLYNKIKPTYLSLYDGIEGSASVTITDEQVAVYCILKLIYNVCATNNGDNADIVIDKMSLLDNFVNQNFNDIRNYLSKPKTADEIEIIRLEISEAMAAIERQINESEKQEVNDSMLDGDTRNEIIAAIIIIGIVGIIAASMFFTGGASSTMAPGLVTALNGTRLTAFVANVASKAAPIMNASARVLNVVSKGGRVASSGIRTMASSVARGFSKAIGWIVPKLKIGGVATTTGGAATAAGSITIPALTTQTITATTVVAPTATTTSAGAAAVVSATTQQAASVGSVVAGAATKGSMLKLGLAGFGTWSTITILNTFFSNQTKYVFNYALEDYNMALAMNTIYESILSLSKNYRNISVTHMVDQANIIANDIQLLRNGNSIKMSVFNKESMVGTISQILSNIAASSVLPLFKDGNKIERVNYATNETFLLHNINFSKRKISNLDNPGNWITYNFAIDNKIPNDKLYSIYTSQPNAEFIDTAGVNEPAIVASCIMKKIMQEYYGGTITIFGNNNIFVGDKLYINDKKVGMEGVVEVREVLQSFSPMYGFTTTVVPSLLVSTLETYGIRNKSDYFKERSFTYYKVAALTAGALYVKGILTGAKILSWMKFASSGKFSIIGKLMSATRFAMFLGMNQYATQTAGRINNYMFPGLMSTLVGNIKVEQSIICMNKNGAPFISNMEGINFANILAESGVDPSRIQDRILLNMSESSSTIVYSDKI